MSADTRRDPGEFYPGGRRIITVPVAEDGDVKHSDFSDLTVETNTIPRMRQAIEELAQRLGATVAALAVAFTATGAGFDSVPVNEIDFDENPSVVTNVTFDGLLQAETDPSWAARSNAVMQAVWSLGSLACLDALGWSDITNKPSWIGDTKPSYSLNDVAPNAENWLGVQGNAGRTIKILAQGSGSSPAGGVQVTASTLNNNNTTTYAYSGVAVKRNGTNTDYLWDTTSSSGIVRRAELTSAAQSATNYTDAAIGQIPEPDFSAENSDLVATIQAVAPAPGNYATVSNKAVNAVQSEWITQAEDGYRMGLGDGGLLIDRVDCDEVMFRAKYGPDRVVIGNNRKLGLDATGDLHGMWIGDDPLDEPRNTTLYENGMITRWDASGNLHEITIPTNQSQGTFALTADLPGNYSTVSNRAMTALQSFTESDPNVPSWAKAPSKPSYIASEVGAAPSSLTSAVTSISNNIASISAMLNAENARFVSTNYNSQTYLPEAYVEAKIDNTWLTIWNEMTRWNWLTDEYLPTNFFTKYQVNAALDDKADRAWGFYDSHSGLYAPEGYTWVSSPKIAVAGGLAYSRTLTSEGAIWVLESNGMVTETGGLTNGFFRVSDDEGNALFEIVKGDKRTVGASANSCQIIAGFTPTKLQIGYAVQSETHPTLQIATSLAVQDWCAEDSGSCPANVTWSGVSGAYVATVQAKSSSATSLFVKAEYQVGGETYIKNTAPISADGGILCTDGIHKVRPVYNNGTITWEVVQ